MGTHVLILTVVVIGLLFCSLRDSRNIHSLRSELHSFRKDLHNVRNDLFKSEALVFKNETELLQVIMDIKKRMPQENRTGQIDYGEEISADGSNGNEA